MSQSEIQKTIDYKPLQERLGYNFHNTGLLQLALTHPSIIKEAGATGQTNQRLEFLGDSVLGLVLSQALFLQFPALDEGLLTKARARLVNKQVLAARARKLELGAVLILSRGEEAQGGRTRDTALADAYESVLGALFLDGGLAAAKVFILREFAEDLNTLNTVAVIENPKGELQELLQAHSPEAPKYEVIAASGPDHARSYCCRVLHENRELGCGTGSSKKAAESAAAQAALQFLGSEKLNQSPSNS